MGPRSAWSSVLPFLSRPLVRCDAGGDHLVKARCRDPCGPLWCLKLLQKQRKVSLNTFAGRRDQRSLPEPGGQDPESASEARSEPRQRSPGPLKSLLPAAEPADVLCRDMQLGDKLISWLYHRLQLTETGDPSPCRFSDKEAPRTIHHALDLRV